MITVYNNTLAVQALEYTTIDSDTDTAGEAVDTGAFGNDFRDVLFVVAAHTLTDGVFAVAVEESDVSNDNFAAVPAHRVLGALPTLAATADDTVASFGARPTKRYVRIVVTTTETTDGGSLSAIAVLGNGSNNPVARA